MKDNKIIEEMFNNLNISSFDPKLGVWIIVPENMAILKEKVNSVIDLALKERTESLIEIVNEAGKYLLPSNEEMEQEYKDNEGNVSREEIASVYHKEAEAMQKLRIHILNELKSKYLKQEEK